MKVSLSLSLIDGLFSCTLRMDKIWGGLKILLGIAIGGDVFPGSSLSDHVLRFNNIPQVRHRLDFSCHLESYLPNCINALGSTSLYMLNLNDSILKWSKK